MKSTLKERTFDDTFTLPYMMGYFLAAGAVRDLCAVVDGSNCVMQKVELMAGNHDFFSTIFSQDGMHRVICTGAEPLSPYKNPEKRLSALLNSLASSGRFGAIALTALPFCGMAGVDYAGVAAAVRSGCPVGHVPPLSMDADWLEGYDDTLASLARVLPLKGRKSRRKAAVAGYFMDRGEYDHLANMKEMARLLALAGLELVSVWPSGGDCAGLSRVGEAGLIISLPYGRKAAAALAERTGAALLETGLPMGLSGTSAWLSAARRAAGIRAPLPPAILREEREAAAAIAPALRGLQHRRALFAGDPHLFEAFSAFCAGLCVDITAAFFDSGPRPLGSTPEAGALLFAPRPDEAVSALASLGRYRKPEFAVTNTFGVTEGITRGLPFMELGFPSYGHHCLADEPFLFYSGARTLAARMLNCLRAGGVKI